MSHASAMLDTHPRPAGTIPHDVLADVLHTRSTSAPGPARCAPKLRGRLPPGVAALG